MFPNSQMMNREAEAGEDTVECREKKLLLWIFE